MLFSHAPAGFITTYITSKIWKEKLTGKQTFWLFLIGTVFAVLPDLDLFYFYFVSAPFSHREMLTHTPIFYLAICTIIFFIGKIFKKQFIKSVSVVILFSALSHLILDSLGSGVAWLLPANKLLYGLLSIPFLSEGFYGANMIAFSYSMEIIIIVIFFNLLFYIKYKKHNLKNIFSILTFSIAFIVIGLLFYANQFLFSRNANNYYGDIDRDGIMNMSDLDIDGDGILNINDFDSNSNRQNNQEDIKETISRMEGVYYDKTEKGYYELFSRFGVLANIDSVLKPYDYAGIFLGKEMNEDYIVNSQGYIDTPSNYFFHYKIENLYNYCENKKLFINNNLKLGDIIFYEHNNKLNHVSLFTEEPNLVLDIGIESRAIKVNMERVVEKFGSKVYYCRILK